MKLLSNIFHGKNQNKFNIKKICIKVLVNVVSLSICFSFKGCSPIFTQSLNEPDANNPNNGVVKRTFKYVIFEMAEIDLLFNYDGKVDGSAYDVRASVRKAFSNCNTTLSEQGCTQTCDIDWPTISSGYDFYVWQVEAYSEANYSDNKNISVMFGAHDVDIGFSLAFSSFDNPLTVGVTVDRDNSSPSVTLICWDRIQKFAKQQQSDAPVYYSYVYLSWTEAHELGHARGITDEGTLCSGNNLGFCVMKYNNEYIPNPVFCDYHKNIISAVTW